MNSNVVIKMAVMLSVKLLDNFVNVIAHLNFGVLKACNKINWVLIFPIYQLLNEEYYGEEVRDNLNIKLHFYSDYFICSKMKCLRLIETYLITILYNIIL